MARLVEGMGSIDSPTHTQKDCVESDLSALKLFAQFTVLSLRGFQLGTRSRIFAVFDFYQVDMAVLDGLCTNVAPFP
eukprot:1147003-Pelagomonas_calceolata.AAC.1